MTLLTNVTENLKKARDIFAANPGAHSYYDREKKCHCAVGAVLRVIDAIRDDEDIEKFSVITKPGYGHVQDVEQLEEVAYLIEADHGAGLGRIFYINDESVAAGDVSPVIELFNKAIELSEKDSAKFYVAGTQQ